jgi:hypothetical protein
MSVRGPVARSARIRVLGTVAVIFASFLACSTRASALSDPYADAASVIICPAGPSGWSVPGDSTGRVVEDPLTPISGGVWGGDQVNVDCNYQTSAGGHLKVTVRYALPAVAFNPITDFDIGCDSNVGPAGAATAPMAWHSKTRLYRVLSSKAWVYATFEDPYHQLDSGEVGVFESVARRMLAKAVPEAHGCKITLAPQALKTLWAFSFDAKVSNDGLTTTGGTTGTFYAATSAGAVGGAVTQLQSDEIGLQIANGSTSVGSVLIRLMQPSSFSLQSGPVLTTQLQVVQSTYAPCSVGATGTLTIDGSGTATVQICNQNLLAGTGSDNALIIDATAGG